MTKAAWLESSIIFLLLLPFYFFFLQTPGTFRAFGFAYFAAIALYVLFLSPHRIPTPEAGKSRLEVFVMLVWSMTVIWGILPAGPIGKMVGQVLLGVGIAYVLLFARHFQGDSLEDWGMGSPRKTLDYLKTGRHRLIALLGLAGVNVAIFLAAYFFPEIMHDLIVGIFRRAGGSRLVEKFPPEILEVMPYMLTNFILMCVVRYDNLLESGKIVGLYLLCAFLLAASAGYIYIYVMNGGWVEFAPRRGITGIGAYIVWGTLQEVLFLSYFNTRIRKGISSPVLSALLTGMIFSIYHIAAYTLMTLCFFVGIIWALIFQAQPNLLVLGLSHGLSGGFGSAFKVQGMTMFKIKASVGPFNL